MKRWIAAAAALLLFALTACGQTDGSSAVSAASDKETAPGEGASSSVPAQSGEEGAGQEARVLVAYFSATGNTEKIASLLAETTGADLYEILPEVPYTEADLDYSDDGCRANLEQNQPDARPAVQEMPENTADYDVVFLGYPIWWGKAPRVICTFLESGSFDGTVIVPFCTSGSSGISGSVQELSALVPGARWLEGARFDAGADLQAVSDWVQSLGVADTAAGEDAGARLLLTFAGGEAVVETQDNAAVRDFLTLLPLTLTFEDFAGTEKISYLAQSLSVADAPSGCTPQAGDVTLYVPWGNLAVFYQDADASPDLVPIGRVVSGLEQLAAMEGAFEVSVSIQQ